MIYLLAAVALLLLGAYFLFRNTMNSLQYIGKLYWITRDNGKPGTKHIAFDAFMRGTAPPWKIGRGVQFRWGKYTFQVGICHDGPPAEDEVQGLLNVLGGHMWDEGTTLNSLKGHNEVPQS